MHASDPALTDSRRLSGAALGAALSQARERSLLHLSLWRQVAWHGGQLPLHPHFNPPAWEAGHIAWFQEFWTTRNSDRARGAQADADSARTPSRLDRADELYHSGQVAHDLRWKLPLPEAARLRDYQLQALSDCLALLAATEGDDNAHYFHRLALFHEDMHNEAAVYMANHFGAAWKRDTRAFAPPSAQPGRPGPTAPAARTATLADTPPAAAPAPGAPASRELAVPAGVATLGHHARGFAFDNEVPPLALRVPGFDIDRQLVGVGEYWQFVAAGGYRDPRWWSVEGWAAVAGQGQDLPRFHRERAGQVQRCCFGIWRSLDPGEAMLHVSAFEAEAWCRWAGRALPTEAQWLRAVAACAELQWGQAWEWTCEPFNGYPGFQSHPYRDYSQPWFGNHRLLKGASFATEARMRAPQYRNFYLPSRTDIFCGFRSCSPPLPAA